MLPNETRSLVPATVQSTEEAIVNAMIAAETMTGIDDHTVIALPHERLREFEEIQPTGKISESSAGGTNPFSTSRFSLPSL